MPTPAKIIKQLLNTTSHHSTLRAGSLLITVFGDSIAPLGNTVALTSLISALEHLGLNARQVRTAVFRLVREDWLMARQKGRRSYYSLTETGMRHFTRAARRIYADQRPRWDGKWTLVIPAHVPAGAKDALRRELLWLGYGAISPGMYAHPTADRRFLDEVLQERKLADKVVVLSAQTRDVVSAQGMKELCRECWGLDHIAARYAAFLKTFRPVLQAMEARTLEPVQCFQVRTLLIHEYRRILLHDTDLPDELLPVNWPGREALNLTSRLYQSAHQGAVKYLRHQMERIEGPLPAPDRGYYQRFGGLVRTG